MHINTGPSDVAYGWAILVAVIPFIAHVILAISIVFLCLYVHNRAFNVQWRRPVYIEADGGTMQRSTS